MTRANKLISYTIADWEAAAEGREDIVFNRFYLDAGTVSTATGCVLGKNKKHPIVWDYRGRAYYRKNRVIQYDIKL